MEDADEDVKPGFTAVVSIVVDSVEDGLMVANDALIEQEDGTILLAIMNDGEMEMIPVEVGAASDAYTEIISDQIAEGDEVAILSTATGGEFGENGPMMGGGMMGGMLGGGGGGGGGQPGGGGPGGGGPGGGGPR